MPSKAGLVFLWRSCNLINLLSSCGSLEREIKTTRGKLEGAVIMAESGSLWLLCALLSITRNFGTAANKHIHTAYLFLLHEVWYHYFCSVLVFLFTFL
jgi:hypothetical protein